MGTWNGKTLDQVYTEVYPAPISESHGLFFFFDSLPSSRLGVNKAHTERLKKSFFPRAVKALIED